MTHRGEGPLVRFPLPLPNNIAAKQRADRPFRLSKHQRLIVFGLVAGKNSGEEIVAFVANAACR